MIFLWRFVPVLSRSVSFGKQKFPLQLFFFLCNFVHRFQSYVIIREKHVGCFYEQTAVDTEILHGLALNYF